MDISLNCMIWPCYNLPLVDLVNKRRGQNRTFNGKQTDGIFKGTSIQNMNHHQPVDCWVENSWTKPYRAQSGEYFQYEV